MVLLVAATVYARSGYSGLAFAVLFFVPDVSFAGYLGGPRAGAVTCNFAHSYVGPLIVTAAALMMGATLMWPLIWAAHLGFDRMLGYGLKYPTAFGDTHLGRIGRHDGVESRK